MKVAVTGHAGGLGKAISERLERDGHEIVGFSIENGYDISVEEDLRRIMLGSLECDVFVNCAHDRSRQSIQQTGLLTVIFHHWQDKFRHIINIGSNAPDSYTDGSLGGSKYRAAKAALDSLVLDTGEPASLAAHQGEVVLIYFGYTYCPDVCPLTLSVAATAIDGLGDRGDDVQLFMVTLDPERDGLEELGEYVRHFNPDFQGISGAMDDLTDVAALYGVFHEQQAPDENGFYLVDHTATLLGVGPEGTLDVVWSPNVASDDLRRDLEEMLG